jgi:hypothetical protein
MAARKLIPKGRRLGVVLNHSAVDERSGRRKKKSGIKRLFGGKG